MASIMLNSFIIKTAKALFHSHADDDIKAQKDEDMGRDWGKKVPLWKKQKQLWSYLHGSVVNETDKGP